MWAELSLSRVEQLTPYRWCFPSLDGKESWIKAIFKKVAWTKDLGFKTKLNLVWERGCCYGIHMGANLSPLFCRNKDKLLSMTIYTQEGQQGFNEHMVHVITHMWHEKFTWQLFARHPILVQMSNGSEMTMTNTVRDARNMHRVVL